MTRTDRRHPTRETGRGASNADQRRKQISMACSKLLRHQAQNEKVPIDAQGWVNLIDLLSWKGISSPHKFDPAVTTQDIFDVVEEDGKHGKGRFGVKLTSTRAEIDVDSTSGKGNGIDANTGDDIADATQVLTIASATTRPDLVVLDPTSKNGPETQQALQYFAQHPSTSPSSFFIRATQGHSIKAVESEGLLQPITLDDPSTIPTTVVHGTFYGAWDGILATGGLKPMGRNNVHFATGPSIHEVLPRAETNTITAAQEQPTELTDQGERVDQTLHTHKVISGMRSDAQILIYIDLRRCLEDVSANGYDMRWFRSDNGVILTDGVAITSDPTWVTGTATATATASAVETAPQQQHGQEQRQQPYHRIPSEKLVPTQYWQQVVEVKAGLGVLWKHGQGVVKELPRHLRDKPLPRGKGARTRGRGRGRGGGRETAVGAGDGAGAGRPKLNVERSGMGDIGGDGID